MPISKGQGANNWGWGKQKSSFLYRMFHDNVTIKNVITLKYS